MSESSGAEKAIGLFLALFGFCSILLGGGCTLILMAEMSGLSRGGGGFGIFILLALFVLAGGAAAMWAGFRLVRGSSRGD